MKTKEQLEHLRAITGSEDCEYAYNDRLPFKRILEEMAYEVFCDSPRDVIMRAIVRGYALGVAHGKRVSDRASQEVISDTVFDELLNGDGGKCIFNK